MMLGHVRYAVLAGVTACSFTPSGEPDSGTTSGVDAETTTDAADGDGANTIDAAMIDAAAIDAAPTTGDVVHIADDSVGTGDLLVASSITTQTSGGSFGFGMALPSGVSFTTAAQDPSGPELAVLRVRNLTIAGGVTVRVV